ncbi:TPA: helix-turn-helix domain-containing protein [Stenotrophomonas maltophilia]|uniref:helix-turn-helix domain-containing protein n=1 Tax=Stenotrophomonas maltophilia TaxID=40324 RepID=UPI00114620C1|nr:helix-turn-helix domain-containing protein [Stenotrophomonas maltophilia]MCD5965587.1 helix-turn-helix domain-containing protein [Stenotrophomonas maltophilia]QGL75278.1 helix-turn-helix domain-containing protein [Stenotrophomonas maltophilia]
MAKVDEQQRQALAQAPGDLHLTAAQAAVLMQVSTKTLQRLRSQGMPPPPIGERPPRTDERWSTTPVRYRKSDVDAWLQHPVMPSVQLHAFQVAEGVVVDHATNLDDSAVVGCIFDLLTELQWSSTELMIEAQQVLFDEQQQQRDVVQERIALHERNALTQALR